MQEELMSSIDDNTNIKLDKLQQSIVRKNLDDDGRLSCIKAFSVARKIGHNLLDMSAITKSMNISISSCELGVFGKLEFTPSNKIIYDDLEESYNGIKRLDCKLYWESAREYTLRKVGSTVKHSDFEVINCQLGCFKEKKGKKNGS
jgi:hypothetical protein